MIKDLDKKLAGEIPVNYKELIKLVSSWGRTQSISFNSLSIKGCEPKECYPLDKLDVSQITSFFSLFIHSPFNGDISKWNMSNASTLTNMFCLSDFNGDLSKWDVSNVEKTAYMFSESQFNNDSLKNWNLKKLEYANGMFCDSIFNGDISKWDISACINFEYMFFNSKFAGDISKWQFKPNALVYGIIYNDKDFFNKYNNGNPINCDDKNFLVWFEKNREKIRELNLTQEDKEIIDDYLSSFKEKNITKG